MEIISTPISVLKIKTDFMTYFSSMVKAVVDIEKRIIAIDSELHADLESLLLGNGSLQENLWGFNIYPDKSRQDCIEYTSLTNIRPAQNNFSMEVEDEQIQNTIKNIVEEIVDFEA